MAIGKNRILAVVPARGGSKGIPGKNLRIVGSRSLVGHAARICTALPELDASILSTDDPEIAAEGARHGLDAPFFRPDDISGDTSSSADMWRHAWFCAEEHYGMEFDISVLLEPTSPMRSPEDVRTTLAALMDGDYAAAATVSPTPAHHAPQKTLTINAAGELGFYDPTDHTARRQDIPPYYHRNGLCYAVRRETLVARGHIIEEGCVAVVVTRPIVNIDEPFDLELAEFLMTRTAQPTDEPTP